MDKAEKDQQTQTSESDTPVTSGPANKIFSILAIVAFVLLIIAVNATTVYFGSKKNKASEPLTNPVTEENQGEELENMEESVENQGDDMSQEENTSQPEKPDDETSQMPAVDQQSQE
jgi:flagellar basal body-associated protein FliL